MGARGHGLAGSSAAYDPILSLYRIYSFVASFLAYHTVWICVAAARTSRRHGSPHDIPAIPAPCSPSVKEVLGSQLGSMPPMVGVR